MIDGKVIFLMQTCNRPEYDQAICDAKLKHTPEWHPLQLLLATKCPYCRPRDRNRCLVDALDGGRSC